MSNVTTGRAEACANIALAKYWGKSEKGGNLTAVPSLSLTLDALRTRTEVTFDARLTIDEATMNGRPIAAQPLARIVAMLDRFRALSGETRQARVLSENNFPTAAGLASSASGFAALAVATAAATRTDLSVGQLSGQARRSSASAARSLYEGFATLGAEEDEGLPLAPADHWDIAMVVGVVTAGPKAIGSTGGMLHTKDTSPYYSAWERAAPEIYENVKAAVLTRDFERVAINMEHSTRLMHATMLTSLPPVLYLKGPTVDLMHCVAERRAQGEPMAYTMDAGPNVKVLTLGTHVKSAVALLESHPGVEASIVCRPGPRATTLALDGTLREAARLDSKVLPPFEPLIFKRDVNLSQK
jgi:diphosphomevalonate decarboxylase